MATRNRESSPWPNGVSSGGVEVQPITRKAQVTPPDVSSVLVSFVKYYGDNVLLPKSFTDSLLPPNTMIVLWIV